MSDKRITLGSFKVQENYLELFFYVGDELFRIYRHLDENRWRCSANSMATEEHILMGRRIVYTMNNNEYFINDGFHMKRVFDKWVRYCKGDNVAANKMLDEINKLHWMCRIMMQAQGKLKGLQNG